MMLSAWMMRVLGPEQPIVYTIEVFNSSGTFNAPPGVSSVEVLIVAGGGGGGSRQGGGGGGGGVKYLPACAVTPSGSISVTVGVGGSGGTSGGRGSSGSNSSFGSHTATGGGGGGGRTTNNQGLPGGSAGGNAANFSLARSIGILGQGREGGLPSSLSSPGANAGGGGGGATQPGVDGQGVNSTAVGGNGGDGIYIESFESYGDSGWFGGGGGGGAPRDSVGAVPGDGGQGGGGAGGDIIGVGVASPGYPGVDGTGGGGGASNADNNPGGEGGKGGDGVVIVRYPSELQGITPIDYLGSSNVCTIDSESNIISAKNEHTLEWSASIIKLLTCLVAREWVPDEDLSDTVTFTSDDTYTPTSANLEVGDVLSLEDVFYGVMVPSGNDAAQLLSRVVGEMILTSESTSITTAAASRNRFIQEMDSYASTSGWGSLVVGSAHGAETTSEVTPFQACDLMRHCYGDLFLRTVAGADEHLMTITGSNARTYTIDSSLKDSGFLSSFADVVMSKTGLFGSRRNRVMAWENGSDVGFSCVMTNLDSHGAYAQLRRLIDHEQSRFL